jgi:hypothetical protein
VLTLKTVRRQGTIAVLGRNLAVKVLLEKTARVESRDVTVNDEDPEGIPTGAGRVDNCPLVSAATEVDSGRSKPGWCCPPTSQPNGVSHPFAPVSSALVATMPARNWPDDLDIKSMQAELEIRTQWSEMGIYRQLCAPSADSRKSE